MPEGCRRAYVWLREGHADLPSQPASDEHRAPWARPPCPERPLGRGAGGRPRGRSNLPCFLGRKRACDFNCKAFLTLWRRTAASSEVRAKENQADGVVFLAPMRPHQPAGPPPARTPGTASVSQRRRRKDARGWGGGGVCVCVDTAVLGWGGAHPCTCFEISYLISLSCFGGGGRDII